MYFVDRLLNFLLVAITIITKALVHVIVSLIFTDMQVQRPIQPIAIVTSEDHNIDITTHRLTDNHSMLAWLFSLLAP